MYILISKTCPKCHIHKELDEFACQQGRTSNRSSWCLLCRRERRAAQRQKDPGADHRYYLAHKEESYLHGVKRRQKNPEAVAAYMRGYSLRNAVALKKKRAAYYQKNKGRIKITTALYRIKKRALCAEISRRAKARRKNAKVRDLTLQQWEDIQIAQKHKCYYCGKKCFRTLTQDHIVALSKGGNHTLHNVIGSCRSCNCRKNAGPPPIPVQPFLLSLYPPLRKAGEVPTTALESGIPQAHVL